jgi:hypothetical protein
MHLQHWYIIETLTTKWKPWGFDILNYRDPLIIG